MGMMMLIIIIIGLLSMHKVNVRLNKIRNMKTCYNCRTIIMEETLIWIVSVLRPRYWGYCLAFLH